MTAKWITGALVAATLAVPAFGQIHVYIGSAPPPIRYERRPPPPGEGFVWTDGYWGTQDGEYVWVPGRWQQAPYAGAYWSHPHYDHYNQGWRMHEGHWDREDHRDRRDEDRDDHDEGRGHRDRGDR